MKITKLLKSILIPTLGISTIGIITAVSTSCGSKINVVGVSLDKTSTTLVVGETDTLIATVSPEDATDKSVTWTSSNTNVATVDQNGTITAKAAGTATIIVTTKDGGFTATCEVNVDTIHVTSIELDKTSTTLAVGETDTLIATVLPENATDRSVTWTSSNTSVATVADGQITAAGLGKATITATTNDSRFTATCEVNVNTIHVTSIELDKTSTTLAVGETDTLIATVLPENATDRSVTWTSSNTNVATVDQNRTITAVGLGNATITATTNDSGFTATCEVNVDTIHVTSIELDKTSTTLAVGETDTLIATVLPENATDRSVTWTSSNTNVAAVDQNGTITAVAAGTATITAITNDSGFTDTCEVTVANQYVILTAKANSTLTLNNNGDNNLDLKYSTDRISWNTYSRTLYINQGQTLLLKGDNPTGWSISNSLYSSFSISGDVSISGNVMGLLDNGAKPGEQGNITDIPCDFCFYDLFDNSAGITSVSEDFLPATTLAKGCYGSMFRGCSALTTAPELPATSLAENCYQFMFSGCSALEQLPEGLLPATTLADYCYGGMFQGCSALTTAPELPAKTLVNSCYLSMFYGCSALTTAPKLLAITLANYCYNNIFYGCSSLNSIKIGYTGSYDSTYFVGWVTGVADSGTFYYNGDQTPQDFKLPSGWTVVSRSVYVVLSANADSTLTLNDYSGNDPNLQYSTDGISWNTYSRTLYINQGQSLYLKGNNPNGWSISNSLYSSFSISGDVSISGNVMGLLDNGAKPGEQGNITDIPCDFCFYDLFDNSAGITSVSEDFLPATTLEDYCYNDMFYQCSSLTTAPELPATTLATNCYRGMFRGCSSLTTTPELLAKTLSTHCYAYMFYDCTSLNLIKIGYTGYYSTNYFDDEWVDGVASSGTFYYNGDQTPQDFKLPSGWTKRPF